MIEFQNFRICHIHVHIMINQYPSAYFTVWVPHTVPARYQRIKVFGHQKAPAG